MPARLRKPNPRSNIVRSFEVRRDAIDAIYILKRLQKFLQIDPDRPQPSDVRMNKLQIHAALALLRKVLPDLASVEVSGNPDKPLMVQIVRFADNEELSQPRPVLEMGQVIELQPIGKST
jgi:hypothetical protein